MSIFLLYLLSLFICSQFSLTTDYYGILNVSKSASFKEIKKSYHKLAMELHPDKLGSDITEEKKERFIKIVLAYEVLSDEDKRREYDQYGPRPTDNRGERSNKVVINYASENFDYFARFAGGAFELHIKNNAHKKMPNTIIPIELTLEEIYKGLEVHKTVARNRICQTCNGTGAFTESDIKPCSICEGRGNRIYLKDGIGGFAHAVNTTCSTCQGSGKIIDNKCPICGGHHVVSEEKSFTLHIHPGIKLGWNFVEREEGNCKLLHTCGDLVFVVKENEAKKHPLFNLDDGSTPNLYCTIRITLIAALVGFRTEITHLNGDILEIKKTALESFSDSLTLKYRGMPTPDVTIPFGDLIINFEVVFPKKLTYKQRKLLESIMDEDDIVVLEKVLALNNNSYNQNDNVQDIVSDLRCGLDPFICLFDIKHYILNILLRVEEDLMDDDVVDAV